MLILLIFTLLQQCTASKYQNWNKLIQARNDSKPISTLPALSNFLHKPYPAANPQLPRQLDFFNKLLQNYNIYSTSASVKKLVPKSYANYPGVSVQQNWTSTNVTHITSNPKKNRIQQYLNFEHMKDTLIIYDGNVYHDPRLRLSIMTFFKETSLAPNTYAYYNLPSNLKNYCKDYRLIKYTVDVKDGVLYASNYDTGRSVLMQKVNIPTQLVTANAVTNSSEFLNFDCTNRTLAWCSDADKQDQKVHGRRYFYTCNRKPVPTSHINHVITQTQVTSQLELSCDCPVGCLFVFDGQVLLAIADGIIQTTVISSTNLYYIHQQLNGYASDLKNFYLHCPKLSTNKKSSARPACYHVPTTSRYRSYLNGTLEPSITRRSPSLLKEFFFTFSLMIVHTVPVGPLTIPKLYCAAKRSSPQAGILDFSISSEDYIPPQVIVYNGQKFVDFGIFDGVQKFGPDPQFISASLSRLPTEGSCLIGSNYLFQGNFSVIKPDRVPLCGPQDHIPRETSCYAKKLVPKQVSIFAQRRLVVPPTDCKLLCNNRIQCTQNELNNPLYHACILIGRKIDALADNLNSVSGSAITYTSSGVVVNVTKHFQLTQNAVKVAQVKFQPRITTSLKAFEKYLGYFSLFSTDSYPNAVKDIFTDVQYNSIGDMHGIAAFPWIAGFRFGRQINTINYSIKGIMETLRDLIPQLNENFHSVKTAISALSSQISYNYQSISQLYQIIGKGYEELQHQVNHLTVEMSNTQYMAAKLATLNQLYTELSNQKQTLDTNLKLYNIRLNQCRGRDYGCIGASGVYLYHAEVATPDYLHLIIDYLGPETCEDLFQSSSLCLYDTLYLPPFPCIFQSKKSSDDIKDYNSINMTNGEKCLLDYIKVDGCHQERHFIQQTQLSNLFHVEIPRGNVTITKLDFQHSVANISNFNQSINKILDNIKEIAPVEHHFTKMVDQYFKQMFPDSTWSVWDWLILAGVIFVVILLLPIIIPLVQSCIYSISSASRK